MTVQGTGIRVVGRTLPGATVDLRFVESRDHQAVCTSQEFIQSVLYVHPGPRTNQQLFKPTGQSLISLYGNGCLWSKSWKVVVLHECCSIQRSKVVFHQVLLWLSDDDHQGKTPDGIAWYTHQVGNPWGCISEVQRNLKPIHYDGKGI